MFDLAPYLNKFLRIVVDPIVNVLFALAVFYFMYGVFKYVRDTDSAESHKEGARHIWWSTVGLFIMISFWGIMRVISDSFNSLHP